MMGMIAMIQSASFQLIISRRMLAPIIINADETMDTSACDTNSFIESASAVMFVSNFEGVTWSINKLFCRDILSDNGARRSRATLSEVYVWIMVCRNPNTNMNTTASENWMMMALTSKWLWANLL